MSKHLKYISNSNGLGASHLRVVMVLREMNASCAVISAITGLSKNRTSERLHDLRAKGIAIPIEERSDSTVIWGLVASIRPTGLVSVPLPGQKLRRYAGSLRTPLDSGLALLNAALNKQQTHGATGAAKDSEAGTEGSGMFNLGEFEDE